MASTLATFDFALKTRYTDQKVENLTMADRPLFAMTKRNEDLSGTQLVIPLVHVNPQGAAGDALATAQTNATNVVGKKFAITPGDYFAKVDIGDKVLVLSRGNAGAFLENQLAETDGLYEQVADNFAIYQWGAGGGALGQRASAATNVITLINPQDTLDFEEGMTVVASAGDGTGGSDALRAGSTTVASVQREAGTVTLTSAAGITSFADNDFLFRQGDFWGNTTVAIFKGVQAFVTSSSAPAALYGMTRTTDPQRLAGCRVPATDLSGKNIEERIRLLGAYMSGRYKTPGGLTGFLHPEDWQNLETALAARGQRPLTDESTRFGFMKLQVVMGGKIVDIFPDRYTPKGTFFALRLQNWSFYSPGKLIQTVNGDGLTMLRKATTNDYEFRLKSYPIHATNAPGYNGRVALP
jgi:hypothetical protein